MNNFHEVPSNISSKIVADGNKLRQLLQADYVADLQTVWCPCPTSTYAFQLKAWIMYRKINFGLFPAVNIMVTKAKSHNREHKCKIQQMLGI